MLYIIYNARVINKLYISLAFAFLWLALSAYIGWPWITDLTTTFGSFLGWFIFLGIAAIPGSATALLLLSLIIDNRPKYDFLVGETHPDITILIAAHNEKHSIIKTMKSIDKQDYNGNIQLIIIDDGSTDNTHQTAFEQRLNSAKVKKHIITYPNNKGKAEALNIGLKEAEHDIVITLDADSMVYQNSLKAIVCQLIKSPENTKAVAGTILSRNYKKNLLTRIQQWDYFFGIGVVKKVQSLYQGTLVAQGAFSAYYKDVLIEMGGWPPYIGEDIVLTWGIRNRGYDVGYSELAICFTNTPETKRAFVSQRSRWAMGMLQAFKEHPAVIWKLKKNSPLIWYNTLFPVVDSCYLFVFLPGLAGAIFFQYYAIVGLYTLMLLPLGIIVMSVYYYKQKKSLNEFGLYPHKNSNNWTGLICYALIYQFILSYASVIGYIQFIFNKHRGWNT